MAILRADLERAKGYWPRLAEQTGLNHSTIVRIAKEDTPNPQVETFQKIRNWLDENLPLIERLEGTAQQHAGWDGTERRRQQA